MKYLPHLMALLLVGSTAAHARVKDLFEQAVMECISNPSEMNCKTAAESADQYAYRLRNSDKRCLTVIAVVGATAVTAPFMGKPELLIDEWNRYQEGCG